MSEPTFSVFHLDDDPAELRNAAVALAEARQDRFQLTSFTTPAAMSAALAGPVDAILLDIHLGDVNALDLLASLRAAAPKAAIVVYSQDLRQLRRAIDAGVDDFIYKRKDSAEVPIRLAAAIRLRRRDRAPTRPDLAKVAVGATLEAIARRMPDVVGSAVRAVHLSGESGTGKEVVVDLLAACLEPSVPLVRVNCGAIATGLVEATLFGHAKGAFTGAIADRRGLFEAASGGFIFLDEVASLPRSAQAALLRALDNQEILRVGDHVPRRIDVRVFSACHESLAEMVARGEFRNDLWQRLCEAHLHLPPLRERLGELDALIDHFCRAEHGGPYQITPEARLLLKARSWSEGNVRALRNAIRAMTERQIDGLLTPGSLPPETTRAAAVASVATAPAIEVGHVRVSLDFPAADPPQLAALEERVFVEIVRAIMRDRPLSMREAAKMLKTPPTTLTRRLRQAIDKGLLDRQEVVSLATLSGSKSA